MARSKAKSILIRIFGYGFVFNTAFLLTLYWTFPYELIYDKYVKRKAESAGFVVEMEEVSPHWFTGMKGTNVDVTLPAKRGSDPMQLHFEEASARVHPLDSLFGNLTLDFGTTSEIGRLGGTVEILEEEGKIAAELDIDRLQIGMLNAVWDSLGIGFQGTASGEASVTLSQNKPLLFDGTIDLEIAEAKFGGGMIKGFTVPAVELGDVPIQFTAEAGRITLDPPLKVNSPDIEAEVSGILELKQVFTTSKADLLIKFKPTDKFWKDNGKLAGLAQGLLKNAQAKDGFYTYEMKGRLGRPNFRPKR